MCEPVGNTVGYQIRMESKRNANTKLLFCTTGIILRRLQDDRNLDGVTMVIVDEVHERQQQTDILLVMLRKLLSTTRPDLKVILVSGMTRPCRVFYTAISNQISWFARTLLDERHYGLGSFQLIFSGCAHRGCTG